MLGRSFTRTADVRDARHAELRGSEKPAECANGRAFEPRGATERSTTCRDAGRRTLQVRQEDPIMVSKKLISALAVAAVCSGACTSGAPATSGDPSATESTSAAQVVDGTFTCTPLLTTTPFLTCGASAAAQLSLATSLQTSLAAQMQLAFSSITLSTQMAQNQIVLSSTVPAFTTFFPSSIIVPLTTAGMFTTVVPFPVGTLAPGFALSANIFGFIPTALPGLLPLPTTTTLSTTPLLSTTLLPAINSAQFQAFNTATLNSLTTLNTSTLNTATLTAATMPLTFLFTTPIGATLPLTCSGAVPLGCL
jgi:hypothetical protein